MSGFNSTKKKLKYLLKHGDLYENICCKENVKERHTFLKTNLLIFSRILFLGFSLMEGIQQRFINVKKIKDIQDEIREKIGVNVDIVRTKTFEGFNINSLKYGLNILYESRNISLNQYLEDLKKILIFCDTYDMREIYLQMSDISAFLSHDIVSEYKNDSLSEILFNYGLTFKTNIDESFKEKYGEKILKLNKEDLENLIEILEESIIDKKVLERFKNEIEDVSIKQAINNFYSNDDLETLKNLICCRLNLYINSDSSQKDRIYGKVLKNISIQGNHINIRTINNEGKLINNELMSLYDYLGVNNYEELLNSAKHQSDNQELCLIIALYLYLMQNNQLINNNEKSLSFYDCVYEKYLEQQEKKIKKADYLPPKVIKYTNSLIKGYTAFMVSAMIIFSLFISAAALDVVYNVINKEVEFRITQIVSQNIYNTYKKSSDIEIQLVKEIKNSLESITDKIHDGDNENNLLGKNINYGASYSKTGDSKGSKYDNIEVAKLVTYQDEIVPHYFAVNYANSAQYSNGSVEYAMVKESIPYDKFEYVMPQFRVEQEVSSELISSSLKNNILDLPIEFYPVGDNYVLTALQIFDKNDMNKGFSIGSYRANKYGNVISDEEREYLLSFERPLIRYIYGVSQVSQNTFVDQMHKNSYTSLSNDEVKDIILPALELDETATIEDIYSAISSKKYSKTPTKDAHLTRKIKKMDEKEFIENVASMDSLICNLAATLAVMSDDELIYTSGFMVDNFTGNETSIVTPGHAWAMTPDGEIIEVTPSDSSNEDEEVNEVISNIFTWGLQNNIPIYIISLIILLVLNKLFGKKVKVYIKGKKVESLLTNKEIEEAYSLLKDALYGGTNIPVKRNAVDFLDSMQSELSAFDIEELKQTKNQLQSLKEEKHLLRLAKKLIDEQEYIRENSEYLKQTLSKK